jgi:hypothetical protein
VPRIGDAVIDDPSGLDTDLERHRAITLSGRRHDDLLVETHVIEIAQPLAEAALEPAQAATAIYVLLI